MTEVTPNYKLPLVDFDRRGWQNLYYKAMRTMDAGMTAIMSVADFVGVWENATEYAVGNKVVDGVTCIIYECLISHTSANAPDTFAEDRAAHTTYWSSWSLPARGRGSWNGSTAYAVGDFVSDTASGRVAICTVAHTSTAFQDDIDAGYWDVLATLSSATLGNNTPQGLAASAGSVGVATAASREDHVHAHGNLAGGALHADASGAAAGFLSVAKLTEIGTATAAIAIINSTAMFDGDAAGGDLTGTYPNPTLTSNAVETTNITDANVTNAKLANMAESTIKGRAAGAGTGAPADLTATEATAILDNMVGDSGSGGTKGLVPAPAAGDAAAGKMLNAGGTWSTPTAGPMPRSYLAGLGLSNNSTDPTNDIDIAVGAARDSTNAVDIVLASALTKRLDAAWTVGTGNGGLDTGAIANTTYQVWLIKRSDTGVVDVLFSTSATAPTMPANYDYKRRIGAIIRTSAAIVLFTQLGDEFLRKTSILDINATNPGTSAVTRTLSVPTGIQLWAIVTGQGYNTDTGIRSDYILTALDQTDQAPSSSAAPLADLVSIISGETGSAAQAVFKQAVRTNTSAQIRSRLSGSTANITLRIATHGWIDTRGRDD